MKLELIGALGGVLGVMGLIAGWYMGFVRRNLQVDTNSKRIDLLESKLDRIIAELTTVGELQRDTSTALWGIDGTNGLRGEFRELREWVYDFIRAQVDKPKL